jgi:hypothetical protein
MGAKQELLEKADHEYDGLKAAIKGLDETQMNQVWLGSWGVREILAHVRELLSAASRLPDEHFGEGKSASGLVDGVAAGHYREHADQIRLWRQR